MNKIFKILIFVAIAILQITLMPILNIKGMFPNLVLIGAVCLILADFEEESFLLAAFGGLALDLASPFFFGFYTFFFVGLIFLLRFLLQKNLTEINFYLAFIIAFFAALIVAILENLFLGRTPSFNILIDGLYSGFIGLIFFYFLEKKAVRKQIIKI